MGKLRYRPGWAIGSWFVPILSLFRPKRIADDIWRGSDPDRPQAASGSWREGSVPALFNWWWLAFVVSSFADQASWRGSVGAESISELQLSTVLFLIADVASLVSGILAVKVISRTTARQEARAARALGSPG